MSVPWDETVGPRGSPEGHMVVWGTQPDLCEPLVGGGDMRLVSAGVLPSTCHRETLLPILLSSSAEGRGQGGPCLSA